MDGTARLDAAHCAVFHARPDLRAAEAVREFLQCAIGGVIKDVASARQRHVARR